MPSEITEAMAAALYEYWSSWPVCTASKSWAQLCEERPPQADFFRKLASIALAARPAPEAGSVVDEAEAWDVVVARNAEIVRLREELKIADESIALNTKRFLASTARAERLEKAVNRAIDILHNNLGRQDEKVRDVEPLLRAALQQEGESDE